jgi:hypothetical protein
MSSLCFEYLPVSGTGVFDGPIGKEKRDLLGGVQSPIACPVKS